MQKGTSFWWLSHLPQKIQKDIQSSGEETGTNIAAEAPTAIGAPAADMEPNSRLVDVWVDNNNDMIEQNSATNLPF